MSTISIITALIALLAALVCYAFISQTIQQKREQRMRLLTRLKSRSRTLRFILAGCPEGFLPKEIVLLVLRSLIDITEQLSRLEPKTQEHVDGLKSLSVRIADTQRQTTPQARVTMQSQEQIKEVRASLEELNRFVHQLESRSTLNGNQAENCRNLIKRLVMLITVDGYVINGDAARRHGKIKLAIHYYDLALGLFTAEGVSSQYPQQIEKLQAALENLRSEKENEVQEPVSEEEEQMVEDIANQWREFNEKDGTFEKKNVYD